jgi:GNAT superfamily N-acetyltransferase
VAQDGKTWLLILPEYPNTPQGMVLPLLYPNKTGWIGFFIMNEFYRGKGLGRELWSAMEQVFRDAGTEMIGLDGVEEQVATYTRRGFVDCAQIPLMMRESLKFKPIDVTWSHDDDVELQDLRDIDPKDLSQLDLNHTGLDRSAYWAADVLPSRVHAFGYAIMKDGEVTGLIFARRCPQGVRIGPLYAATYSQARQLLHKLMNDYAQMETGTFVAEIFGSNEQGMKVFEELGWEYTGMEYHRMWLNGKVPVAQQEGGTGVKGMYAIFDAASG